MTTRTTTDPDVADHPDRHRYEIVVDGRLAGVADYVVDGDQVAITHTVVEPEFGGRGLGTRLARAAVTDIRDAGRTVVPACSFVADYLRRHPDDA